MAKSTMSNLQVQWNQVDMPKCSYNLVSVWSGLILEKTCGLFPIRTNVTICSIWVSWNALAFLNEFLWTPWWVNKLNVFFWLPSWVPQWLSMLYFMVTQKNSYAIISIQDSTISVNSLCTLHAFPVWEI